MVISRRDFMVASVAGLSQLAYSPAHSISQAETGNDDQGRMSNMKKELIKRMKEYGAYDVRIADPSKGFEHGLPESHPLKIWAQCRSVIVVITPNTPDETLIPESERNPEGINKIVNDVSPNNTRIHTINHLVPPVMSRALPAGGQYLISQGYQVKSEADLKEKLQNKMCAYEAGIGVYGRSGFLMHPELGNRMCIMTLMTDAPLPPDNKIEMNLNCDSCGLCVASCPVKAYDPEKSYPESYNMQTCAKNRHEVLLTQGRLCQECYSVCPASQKTDEELEQWLKNKAVELEQKIKQSPEGRLPGKVEEFHKRLKHWREAGNDPTPVGKIMEGFEPLLKRGDYQQAETLIDHAMELLEQR